MLLRCFFLFLGLTTCISVSAQEPLTLKGQVIDAISREPLMGATIAISQTQQGTNTRFDGLFALRGVTVREIDLKVSYIGYKDRTLSYRLSEGMPPLTISLTPADLEMGVVEITEQAGGQVSAFLQQKRSITIKNVIHADQIQSFPDMNAAEALQRIPGITLQRDQGEGRYVQVRGTPPELSNFNINGEQIPSPEGDVRYVGMDIIAADQIEYIEVTKVLTPDMDADGIGGNVNIVTKEAREGDPQIRATLSGGYNNLRQTPNYQGQFAFGQRYGKFGFNLNASYYLNQQGADNLEYKFAKGPFFGSTELGVDNYQVQYRELQLRHYDLTRTRLGISPSWDYRFNDKHKIYLRGMYNRFGDNETRRRKVYDLDDALSPTYYLYGGIEHDVRQRTKIQEVAAANLGGEHDLGFMQIEYMLQYARASETRPEQMEAIFDSPGQAIKIDFDVTEPLWPRATYPGERDSTLAFGYDRYELDELSFEESRIIDNNLTARLNLTFPYQLNAAHKGYFKFGGKSKV